MSRQPKRPTCTNHCASCDMHFSSLAAFDAHWSGGCLSRPRDQTKLKWTSRAGICNLTKGFIGLELPAQVWGSPGERLSDFAGNCENDL